MPFVSRSQIMVGLAMGAAFYLGILFETMHQAHHDDFFSFVHTDDLPAVSSAAEEDGNKESFNNNDIQDSHIDYNDNEDATEHHHRQHLQPGRHHFHRSLDSFQETIPRLELLQQKLKEMENQEEYVEHKTPRKRYRTIRHPLLKDHQFRNDPGDNRPPFDSIVDLQSGNITGNVENLLHYAVVGFGKCGTTSMMAWLDNHPELQTYPLEIYDMIFDRPGEMLHKIYSMPVGNYKRGYKSPADISHLTALAALKRHFPRTKLIVGIRHPVLWFQSLYNFRVQNLNPKFNHSSFPTPTELIGRCTTGMKNTCTHKGEFGLYIRSLGKTLATQNARNPDTGRYEWNDLEHRLYATSQYKGRYPDIQELIPNPIFLFEINQLSDEDAGRKLQFQKDMEVFLELASPLLPMEAKTPGRKWDHKPGLQDMKDEMKIDICDRQHLKVRRELMRMARGSSIWLREYFLDEMTLNDPTAGVYVSSPEYLKQLLEDWMNDPCDTDDETTSETSMAGSRILDVLPDDRLKRRRIQEGLGRRLRKKRKH